MVTLLLAVPHIPVGVLSSALAILGAIVSILEFHGWRRACFASIFVLLGAGELVVIVRSDAAHVAEVKVQHDDIEKLKGQVQAAEMARQVDNAYLKAKLETYAQFSPAIMILARTSAEFTRKQYEEKVTSDKELYRLTMGAVKKLRDFSQKEQTIRRRDLDEWMNSARQPKLTEAERQQQWNQQTQKTIQHYYERDAEFRNSILPDAMYAKQELVKRKLVEPAMSLTCSPKTSPAEM